MNLSPERRFYWLEQGALHYVVIGLLALAVIYLDLGQRVLDPWALFPVLVGLAGLATRWTAAPLLLVLALAFTVSLDFNMSGVYTLGSSLLIPDLILCVAVLAYCLAHYRFSLINHAFPRPARACRRSLGMGRAASATWPTCSSACSAPRATCWPRWPAGPTTRATTTTTSVTSMCGTEKSRT